MINSTPARLRERDSVPGLKLSSIVRRLAKLFALLPIALLLLTSGACTKKEAVPPDVIARVGDRMVTLEELKRYLDRNAGTDLGQIVPEAASALLDQFIEELLLSEEAGSRNIEIPAEKIANAVRSDAGSTVMEKRDEMRRSRLIVDVTTKVPEPTAEVVMEYYRQNQAEFNLGERVRVKQILVLDQKTAEEVKQELGRGGVFEELSMKYSKVPNASKGGDIGYVFRGQLPKVFEDEIFKLQPGQISEVIKADEKFHIFKVDDHKEPGEIPLELAEATIRARLKESASSREIAAIVAGARRKFPVMVLTKRLPFTYSGALQQSSTE